MSVSSAIRFLKSGSQNLKTSVPKIASPLRFRLKDKHSTL